MGAANVKVKREVTERL